MHRLSERVWLVACVAAWSAQASAQPAEPPPVQEAPTTAPPSTEPPSAAPPASADATAPTLETQAAAPEAAAETPAASNPEPQPPTAATQPAPAAAPAAPDDLQSPARRSTENSAYGLPARTWGFDLGALGVGSGDVYARLGVGYGIGYGLYAELNLLHWAVGLLNARLKWTFFDSPMLGLSAELGLTYGRGAWMWILSDFGQQLLADLDLVSVPVVVTASAPVTRWLQLDLGLQYTHAELFGTIGSQRNAFVDTQLGLRQFVVRPGARLFVSDRVAVELAFALPAYTSAPHDVTATVELPGILSGGVRNTNWEKLPFSRTWSLEAGLRSRLANNLFGTMRLHYGQVASTLYGAKLYPSFDVEWRL